MFSLLKIKKSKIYLILDIGTEAVKCLFLSPPLEKGAGLCFLSKGLAYYKKYEVFKTRDFESEIIKNAILSAIDDACRNLSFLDADKKIKERALNKKNWEAYITLPPNLFKARIITESFNREDFNICNKISSREEKIITSLIIKSAKEKMAQNFSEEFGILPKDIYWVSTEILDIKIDGYSIPFIKGYEGKSIELRIISSFMPVHYFNKITRIINSLDFDIKKVFHLAECVGKKFKGERTSGIIIDIGGEITQIFGLKEGEILKALDFKGGSKFFGESISEIIGISEESSRFMLERYGKGELSENVEKRVKEIFYSEAKEWYNELKLRIDKMAEKGAFPSNIFLIGGGSNVPEIKNMMERGIPGFSLGSPNAIKLNIKAAGKILGDPQWASALLLCCGISKGY